MKHLGLSHIIRILVGLALVVSLSGCPDMFGPRANPFDPEGDGYQGFDQVDDVNDVYPLPAGDQEFLWLPEIASVGSSGALAYNFLVERPDGDTYTAVFTTETSVPSTSLVDGNLTAGTYTYRVQAKGPDGAWGVWSERSTVRLAAGPAIVTPVADAVIADTTPAFDWEPVAEAASYDVQIVEEDAGFAGAPVLSIDGDGYTATTALSNNTRHQWRVRAVNADGKRTVWSTPVSFTVGWGAMAGLSPADGATVEDTTPTFGWSGVDGAVSYEIQVAGTEAGLTEATPVSVTEGTYTPTTGLANNHTHYWRVRAKNGDGQHTAWSPTYGLTVSWGSISGMSPADGATVTDTTPTLSWDGVTGAVGYEVQVADSEAGVATATAVDVTEATHTPAAALTNNATHYWRVRARNGDGQHTAWSATSSIVVSWGSTSGLSPADGATVTDTTPTLSWDAVDGAASYELRYGATAAAAEAATPVAVDIASYDYPAELTDGVEVFWQVRAKDGDGQLGAWSGAAKVTYRVFSIGDTGPAGGTVFYDKGSFSGGWRYLEAAPSDQSTGIQWGGFGTLVGGTGTAIGTGEANTNAIVTRLGSGSYAARICYDLELGGYDDWFLPSRYELNQLYAQRAAVGGFASDYYWNSSEDGSYFAWNQYFDDGNQDYASKGSNYRVRAVRGF